MSRRRLLARPVPALAALLLALMLATQAGLPGHVHADGGPAIDCPECQLDSNPPALATAARVAAPAATEAPAAARALRSSARPRYRPSARGPPAISC